jgi:hypothetical protein
VSIYNTVQKIPKASKDHFKDTPLCTLAYLSASLPHTVLEVKYEFFSGIPQTSIMAEGWCLDYAHNVYVIDIASLQDKFILKDLNLSLCTSNLKTVSSTMQNYLVFTPLKYFARLSCSAWCKDTR